MTFSTLSFHDTLKPYTKQNTMNIKTEDMKMKVVVAIDSLKGSLTSMEAGMAIKAGILAAKPDAEVIVKPLADGG